jgi:hypothetical protein
VNVYRHCYFLLTTCPPSFQIYPSRRNVLPTLGGDDSIKVPDIGRSNNHDIARY